MHEALRPFHQATAAWFEQALGEPTLAQAQGWPHIRAGEHTLISAPTGTGKTLAAFLVFIDQLKTQAARGELADALQLLYISPLKALGNDIRENLKRPLEGIGGPELRVAVRTGDTPAAERQRMLRHPPHLLITTPESLFLLLSSRGGRRLLSTVRSVIIDELHALLSTKRGAHLFFSLARLDALCGRRVQRVGLSATITPLSLAAEALAWPEKAAVVAPKQEKKAAIQVTSAVEDLRVLPSRSIWPEIAGQVVERCASCRTVLVFLEGRAQAEKLANEINAIAGEGFARTHHGCVSKEQRLEAERQLREGKLRVLCATSSMELGIDVGDVDLVVQVGCPRSVSGALQRLGRAGHAPGRESVMLLYPKTAGEILPCGLTAELAMEGLLEDARPPLRCLDVLSQQLCSLAVDNAFTVQEALELCHSVYNFRDVTREELCGVLRMLAGDFEHAQDKPVRPRLNYDRIHDRVWGDGYTRLLAVSSGGTIPDRGWYAVTLANGTRLGELDEEFVFEARLGDRFLLGASAWRLCEVRQDRVIVEPCAAPGAQIPFWKGDSQGRSFETSLRFGQRIRALAGAPDLERALLGLRMDADAAKNAARVLRRQMELCGCLPDDRTIVLEHFADEAGEHQLMVHSVFGGRVNRGLEMLLRHLASQRTGLEVRSYGEDDGLLLMLLGERDLPDGLLNGLDPASAPGLLRALLPQSPLFSMVFRYNAARALMLGVRPGGRQPLWVQRLRGAEFLSLAAAHPDHPLMQESLRECLEDHLDLAGLDHVLRGLRDGSIRQVELHLDAPSPLSLPLRRQAEADLMYDYFPTPASARRATQAALSALEGIRPDREALEPQAAGARAPETAQALHVRLMTEGDLLAEELPDSQTLFAELAQAGRALYVEPGLWIAAEEAGLYADALEGGDAAALARILRRCLRYRGGQDAQSLQDRYFLPEADLQAALDALAARGDAILQDGLYHHKDLYAAAQRRTLQLRRRSVRTQPPESLCAYLAQKTRLVGSPAAQLRQALEQLQGLALPPRLWEEVVLPHRCKGYRPALLDALLASGDFFWNLEPGERPLLAFYPAQRLDDENAPEPAGLEGDELTLYRALRRRGASFASSLAAGLEGGASPLDGLQALTRRGLVRADSFAPVRRLLQEQEEERLPPKRRAKARAKALTAGRWELAWGVKPLSLEEQLAQALGRYGVLSKETATPLPWREALELLRQWEFTGRVRRGYFVQGLSGAQFVDGRVFDALTAQLENPVAEPVWLNAADPLQAWGRFLPHQIGQSFLLVPGTAVCLLAGRPVALAERQGESLRALDPSQAQTALLALREAFLEGRLFPGLDYLRCRQYEAGLVPALQAAGFQREALEYVLWKD